MGPLCVASRLLVCAVAVVCIRSLYESLIVNEYLNELEGPSLLPEDPAQRARARLIIDQVGRRLLSVAEALES